ncbi:hypothetical protein [Terrabacter terrigena]|uniref:Uncharacterized protein n=1 Tax=Terrabacter terrigena TaxID=574718 RepID=A0ABW3MXM4_9MICO
MSRRAHSESREKRKDAKRQARRPVHFDKYEHRKVERDMDRQFADLARPFNGEEADDE